MSLSNTYRRLASLIDRLEAEGVSVTEAVPDRGETATDESLTVELRVEIPTEVDEDGGRLTADDGGANDPGHIELGQVDPTSVDVALGDPATPSRIASAGRRDGTGTAAEPTASGTSEDGEPVASETGEDGLEDVDTEDAETEPGGTVDGATHGGTTDEDTSSEDAGGADGESPVVECRAPNCTATFGSEHGMKIHFSKVHRGDAAAYRDPDRLREVYDAHDTFAEMAEALEADVSPQTVRRHAMKHGLHDPDATRLSGGSPDPDGEQDEQGTESDAGRDRDGEDEEADADVWNEGADADGEDEKADAHAGDQAPNQETDRTDGGEETKSSADRSTTSDSRSSNDHGDLTDVDIGAISDSEEMGDGVTVEAVREAVADARTLYDVQQALALEREACVELLEELDLLDLVQGRIADRPGRAERTGELDERLQEHLEGGQADA